MKFALAIGALAASAAAAPELQKRQGNFNTGSALMVLETALPSSLLQLAITNSQAASSMIASEFAAGATPSWFTGLPTDIQTYLAPASPTGNGASALSSAASSLALSPGITPATPTGTPATTPAGSSPTTPTPAGSSPGTTTGGSSSTGGSSGSSSGGSGSGSGSGGSNTRAGGSSQSTGGVPAQTAAIGVGMAGFAAAVGLIAL